MLLLGEEHVRPLAAPEDDPVPRFLKILRADRLAVVAHGDDRGFVHQVRQVRPGEPRGPPRHDLEVDGRVEPLVAAVDLQDRHALAKRPGRSNAGSRTSGRLVAANTTMPTAGSKPSISASIWFSVCSRSSFDTIAPAPPRRCPIASISSMKMIAGARFRASANRSRTRAAPTPTNNSTKLEPVTEKNGTLASPATARASSVLPVPGGPTMSTPRGAIAPARA